MTYGCIVLMAILGLMKINNNMHNACDVLMGEDEFLGDKVAQHNSETLHNNASVVIS